MICFNCGSVLSNSDYCSKCGTDVSIYKKIVRMSNTYYNTGLTKAVNRDLSGAADILRRSVRLNKRNIDARNLLGLVYFEMGETVQAFSEWVISQNIQPENNPANRYMDLIKSNPNRLQELNTSIRKFNVALDYAKQGTDDMAVIQLKKVLNQNPNMIKAHQLLALLYMKHGDYEKARRELKRALKIDRSNSLCQYYLKETGKYLQLEKKNNPTEYKERRKKLREVFVNRPDLSGDDVIIPNNNFKEAASSAANIAYIVAGVLLGMALIYFVITPMRVNKVTKDVSEVEVEYNQKLAIKNSTISELERQVEQLTDERDDALAQATDATSTKETKAQNYKYILKAIDSYMSEDYEKASTYLGKIDTSVKMGSAFNTTYENMTTSMSSYISEAYYNKGMESYNSANYSEAINYLEKCIEADNNYENAATAVYYMAWGYYHLGDNENCIKMFQKIVDDYPNSDYYETAINQVGTPE
ncbi:MAG: tetratricopeptide repeat protein [Eubacterium sp.]